MISDAATTQVAALYRFVRLENYADLRSRYSTSARREVFEAHYCSPTKGLMARFRVPSRL